MRLIGEGPDLPCAAAVGPRRHGLGRGVVLDVHDDQTQRHARIERHEADTSIGALEYADIGADINCLGVDHKDCVSRYVGKPSAASYPCAAALIFIEVRSAKPSKHAEGLAGIGRVW